VHQQVREPPLAAEHRVQLGDFLVALVVAAFGYEFARDGRFAFRTIASSARADAAISTSAKPGWQCRGASGARPCRNWPPVKIRAGDVTGEPAKDLSFRVAPLTERRLGSRRWSYER
jgi:hypothetical protein